MRVKLGEKYRDKVSGFEGVATARYEFLNGCVQYHLVGQSKDGAEPPSLTIDEDQIEGVSEGQAGRRVPPHAVSGVPGAGGGMFAGPPEGAGPERYSVEVTVEVYSRQTHDKVLTAGAAAGVTADTPAAVLALLGLPPDVAKDAGMTTEDLAGLLARRVRSMLGDFASRMKKGDGDDDRAD